MNKALWMVLLALSAAMAACGGSTTTPDATQPTAEIPDDGDSPVVTPDPVSFPESKAVGEMCEATCADDETIGITCAAGETPVCDCDATPRTECEGSEAT